ncbi:MAG: PD40 domain-containing protein [Saprospiraceae bacterium]|nr:PD40 domain-containing protein [Saprospiraceae bacterium]
MLRSILFICLFLFSTMEAESQSPAALKRNGEKAFSDGRWAEAKNLLTQYQEIKPGDLDVLTKLGIAHFELGQGLEARKYLAYVYAKDPDSKNGDLLLYHARTLHGLGEWERAITAYKAFLRAVGDKHPLRNQVAENIRRCVNGMSVSENADIALVENLGALVNSAGDEFAPLPSLNHSGRLYYAAARQGCNGGLRNDDGYEDSNRGHWCSDMFAAKLSNTGWESGGSLGGLLNTSRFEIPLGFNGAGQVLYFFRGLTTYSGAFYADTAARKDEYALEPPAFVSAMKPEAGDCNPFFFNEKTVVFASRRTGGYGGLDLWYSIFADTAWSQPLNLGPIVNSAYDEDTPFLARNGRTLFFSSNRAEGIGGTDIYSTNFNDQLIAWESPVNLGLPVNSPGNDAYFRLSTDGTTAFFSSDRLGGYGQRDLYIAYFKEAQSIQSVTSTPELFADLGKIKSLNTAPAIVVLPALLYETDRDITSVNNLKIVQEGAKAALQHPPARMYVTVFTEESSQAKFDLYYGIKRAELLGKTLVELGVPTDRITLKSVGAAYPLARGIVDGAPNPQAGKINKRAEITFHAQDALGFEFQLQRPQVAEEAAAAGIVRYDRQTQGLNFRILAASTRQILASDAIAMFTDIQIESKVGSGVYDYLVGSYPQFDQAQQVLKEVRDAGFTGAKILAYINNVYISKAEAVGLLKKYPGLAGFIRN